MKILTNKDRFIRMMKLLRDFASVFVLFYTLLLMFCDHEKVVAAIFSSHTIGITALITGVIVGFSLGVYVTYRVFEADEADAKKYYQQPKNKNKNRKHNHNKAANSNPHQPNVATASAPQIIVIEKVDATKVKSMFDLLGEFEVKKAASVQNRETEVHPDILQEETPSEET